jgi:hypothetical protein
MAESVCCPATNPEMPIRFPQRVIFWQQPGVSLAKTCVRINEDTIQPIPTSLTSTP